MSSFTEIGNLAESGKAAASHATRTDLNRVPGESLPMRQAEALTGMKQQRKFVAWWKANVTPGKGWQTQNRERGSEFLSPKNAEALTGMKQQRVSDLGKRGREEEGRGKS